VANNIKLGVGHLGDAGPFALFTFFWANKPYGHRVDLANYLANRQMKSIKNIPRAQIVCFGILLVFLAVQITSTMENSRMGEAKQKK